MSRKIEENTRCPFCGREVICPNRVGSFSDSQYTVTKRRTKQWFHAGCYITDCKVRKRVNK